MRSRPRPRIIHITRIFTHSETGSDRADLLPVARKLICVPETARLENLLQRFMEKKLHFALGGG